MTPRRRTTATKATPAGKGRRAPRLIGDATPEDRALLAALSWALDKSQGDILRAALAALLASLDRETRSLVKRKMEGKIGG